ncbi:MAG: hypothetical protein M1834_007294 [Cirrosporium novae-zelandiae]|nr:MAG: hypothetical protein M1834_007294 [Cirrosporium novae-zelandiae]
MDEVLFDVGVVVSTLKDDVEEPELVVAGKIVDGELEFNIADVDVDSVSNEIVTVIEGDSGVLLDVDTEDAPDEYRLELETDWDEDGSVVVEELEIVQDLLEMVIVEEGPVPVKDVLRADPVPDKLDDIGDVPVILVEVEELFLVPYELIEFELDVPVTLQMVDEFPVAIDELKVEIPLVPDELKEFEAEVPVAFQKVVSVEELLVATKELLLL